MLHQSSDQGNRTANPSFPDVEETGSIAGEVIYLAFTRAWNEKKGSFDAFSSKYIGVPVELVGDPYFDLALYITVVTADRLSRVIGRHTTGVEESVRNFKAAEKLFHPLSIERGPFGSFKDIGHEEGTLYVIELAYLPHLDRYPENVRDLVLGGGTLVHHLMADPKQFKSFING
jgi:hypothetical protein